MGSAARGRGDRFFLFFSFLTRARSLSHPSAAARAGKSVLQLDAAPRFGGGWATLNLEELVAWLTSAGSGNVDADDSAQPAPSSSSSAGDVEEEGAGRLIRLPRPRPGALRGASLLLAPGVTLASLGPARAYALDLAPAPLYAAGPAVAALLAAGAAPYTEFRLAGPGWVWDGAAAGLAPVPASRADVFRDGRLALADKRAVMRFLGGAAAALMGSGSAAPASLADALHSEAVPLAATVARAGLPRVVADAVVYGLAGADADQGAWEDEKKGEAAAAGEAEVPGHPPPPPPAVPAPPAWCAAPLSGKDGGRALSLYLNSLGRYGSGGSGGGGGGGGGGALLIPVHGAGELPQAFARAAAVAGGAAALRRTAVAVEVEGGEGDDDDDGARLTAVAVHLAPGQRLTCRALAAGEEVVAGGPPAAAGGLALLARPPSGAAAAPAPPAVSRAIVILDGPLQPLGSGGGDALPPLPPSPDGTTGVLVLPPRCLSAAYPPAAVRGLQVGPPTAACPPGKVVLYLSTPAALTAGPQADLEPALAALARTPGGGGGEAAEEAQGGRPAVLFAAFYREPGPAPAGALAAGMPANVALLPPPTGALTAGAAAVAAAGAALEGLWPGGAVGLFPAEATAAGALETGDEADTAAAAAPPAGDDSDEEAAAALSAALAGLDA